MVTTREPEWDDEERAKVLALLDYEAQVCSGCGGYLPETTHPDNEGRYRASAPIRCYRCDAVETLRAKDKAAYSDPEKTKNPGALVAWPVKIKS